MGLWGGILVRIISLIRKVDRDTADVVLVRFQSLASARLISRSSVNSSSSKYIFHSHSHSEHSVLSRFTIITIKTMCDGGRNL